MCVVWNFSIFEIFLEVGFQLYEFMGNLFYDIIVDFEECAPYNVNLTTSISLTIQQPNIRILDNKC